MIEFSSVYPARATSRNFHCTELNCSRDPPRLARTIICSKHMSGGNSAMKDRACQVQEGQDVLIWPCLERSFGYDGV